MRSAAIAKCTALALSLLSVSSVTAAGSVDAKSQIKPSVEDNPAAAMMLNKPSVLESLPTRIEYGSIKVERSDYDISELASLATVTVDDALHSTRTVLKDFVTAVELTVVDDYLVWAVFLVRAKGEEAMLTIDAGNGKFLSMKSLRTRRRPWWEF
jgi:hypothetical protein